MGSLDLIVSPLHGVRRIDLKKAYPVSFAFALRRNLGSLSALVGLAALSVVFVLLYFTLEWRLPNAIILKKVLVLGGSVAVILGKFLYDVCFWKRYDYYIQDDRLHIESGVIIRNEASVPLTFLSEFYLEQRFVDLLFGTRDLIMKTALGDGQEVARIEALREPNARGLQRFLIERAQSGNERGRVLPAA